MRMRELAFLSSVALFPTQAAAVSCGDVITTDVVLDADVGPCSTLGAIKLIGPATLDLNGHSILGDDGFPDHCVGLEGEGATLQNGVVRGCQTGVSVRGEGKHVIKRVVSSGHAISGFAVYSESNQLIRNVASGNVLGFEVRASRNRLADNAAIENTDGFRVVKGQGSKLIKNTAAKNTRWGFQTNHEVTDVTFGTNLALRNGEQGYSIEGGGHHLTRNRAVENGSEGLMLGATQSVVAANVALANGTFDLLDGSTDCDENTWRNNIFGSRNRDCIR